MLSRGNAVSYRERGRAVRRQGPGQSSEVEGRVRALRWKAVGQSIAGREVGRQSSAAGRSGAER